MSIGRSIGGGVLGAVAGAATVVVVEVIGHRIWPLPPDVDPTKPEQLKTLLASMPAAALAWVVLGWAAGALVGGLVAALVSRRLVPSLVVGALLLSATAMTFFQIPHPAWMMAAGVVLPVPLAWLGARLGRRRDQPAG